MKKIVFIAAAMMLAPLSVAPAVAGDAPASAMKPTYTTSDTDLGTLLDNPATKAVLMKYIPTMISNPQIDMARSMTLKQLQSYAADQLPDATLAKIDVDLATIPAASPTPAGK
jgi:para-nitrobenzyl esterase